MNSSWYLTKIAYEGKEEWTGIQKCEVKEVCKQGNKSDAGCSRPIHRQRSALEARFSRPAWLIQLARGLGSLPPSELE